LLRLALDTLARKLIAGALALAAILALAWRSCASRSGTAGRDDRDEDRDQDRDRDRDNDRDDDGDLDRVGEEARRHRPPPPPGRWLDIVAPPFTIPAGAADAYCFTTHLPNTDTLAIRRWRSRMSGGIRDIAIFLGPSAEAQAPELRRAPCDRLVAPRASEALVYISHAPTAELVLPPNDGTGRPVAQLAEPGALMVIEMQILNPTERALPAELELHLETADRRLEVTPMSSVIAFHRELRIPPGTAAAPGTLALAGSCALPANVKLFGVSSYTHQRSVHTFVWDGSARVFDSTGWDHPETQAWWTGYPLKSGSLQYGCEYRNPTAQPVVLGSLPDAELCLIVGYVFPAPRPILCPN
jgi:hypothetical protein